LRISDVSVTAAIFLKVQSQLMDYFWFIRTLHSGRYVMSGGPDSLQQKVCCDQTACDKTMITLERNQERAMEISDLV
jgi:hypothetical protein